MNDDRILRELRKTILDVSFAGKDGNLQSCFSSLEIIWTLYDKVLHLSPATMQQTAHDRFVLSKGQSNLALLVVLSEKGFLQKNELYSFCKLDSRVSMQVDRTKFDGIIETSAGSLGHGFPIAVGMAWASKIKQSKEHIYVLAGDGEMNEGTMWEAAMFAASEKLNNLTLIIDNNESIKRMLDPGDWAAKLGAFGFDVQTIDGHDTIAIQAALESRSVDCPIAVIAKTQRGYGSKTMMEDKSWFHRWPNESELETLKEEVDSF